MPMNELLPNNARDTLFQKAGSRNLGAYADVTTQ